MNILRLFFFNIYVCNTRNFITMKTIFFIAAILLFFSTLKGQDLEKLLEDENAADINFTSATFKSTRIVNGHSIERMPEGQLDFRISHRFGQLNTGAYNLWGLDEANIHLSLEYGITNWLMLGIGRGTYEKTFDGFAKFSLLRQSKGDRVMPFSVSYLTSLAINSLRRGNSESKIEFWDRASYVHQLLIARKLNNSFSVEVNPTFVHRNMVASRVDPNDVFALGLGGRMKLTKRVSMNIEYYWAMPENVNLNGEKTFNPLSLGFDIETGGHVFQLFFSNSLAMIEKGFITETTGDWGDGGVRFGFNISRVFTIK